MVRTDATVNDACDEYLRWIEHDRGRKASTVGDYRTTLRRHVRPTFGERPVEDVTRADVEQWLAALRADGALSNRTLQKTVVVFHGVMERARKQHELPSNPVSGIDRPRPATRLEIDVLEPAEVLQLIAAADSDQDAALFATAAFTGCARAS